MRWIEVACEIDVTFADSLSDYLESLGAVAVSFYDAAGVPLLEPAPGETPFWSRMKIVGLFSEEKDRATLHRQLKQDFPSIIFQQYDLPEQDWVRAWQQHFHPLSFGDRLWIMPSHVAVVKLDPGLAFGTGTHPTTSLCLQWLNDHAIPDTVIDYGCGSGILGIAACLLGAKRVWAIDHDPQALHSTRENATHNGLTPDTVITCDSASLPHPLPTAPLVIANILAQPLIVLAPRLIAMCAPEGVLLLSGLLRDQVDSVLSAYVDEIDFDPPEFQEDWARLTGKRRQIFHAQ